METFIIITSICIFVAVAVLLVAALLRLAKKSKEPIANTEIELVFDDDTDEENTEENAEDTAESENVNE